LKNSSLENLNIWLNKNNINKALNNLRYLWLLAILVQLIYIFPLLYLGEQARVVVYDNLDIVIPLNKMLADSGMLFASSTSIVPNMMGGLPRFLYGGDLFVYNWFFLFFKPFTAYLINELLMHTTALLSMLVLLWHYFIPVNINNRNLIIFSTSILFSIVPFYTGSGLSVSLLPLALYAFLNIRCGNINWKNWLIIILIPFYSSLVLVYFFFLLIMTGLFLVDCIRNRRINWFYFAALGTMSAIFILVEHHLFYATFFAEGFVSHRSEFNMLQLHTFLESYRSAHQDFLNGLKNIDTRASAYLVPSVLLTVTISLFKKKILPIYSLVIILLFSLSLQFPDAWKQLTGQKYMLPVLAVIALFLFYRNKEFRLFYGFLLIQIFFSYWYGFWFYRGTGELALTYPILREFNFSRIAYLQPVLWYMIMATSFVVASKRLHFSSLLIIVIFLYQSIIHFNTKKFSFPYDTLSYHSYYGIELFSKIKHYIGKDPKSYRVGSLAMHPAIALYNGFYTIDGYLPNYPLSYKHKFKKVIIGSLTQDYNMGNKELFNKWGSKCYLFDGNESWLLYKPNTVIKSLYIDFRAFYDLGGRYLLSSHKIDSALLKDITFKKKFTDSHTFWKIYLYQVNIPNNYNNDANSQNQ